MAREEYFQMKCCSYFPKDLDKHFQQMSKRFYLIGGIDDTNLKQAYLNSILASLSKEAFQQLEMKGKTLALTTVGDIHQYVMRALQSLCNKRNFFKDFNKEAQKFEKACNKSHLLIKCSGKDGCDCSFSQGKKKHYKKHFF